MAYLVKDVAQLLALMRRLQGKRSSTEFALDLGISKQYLTDIYKGRRDPGESVLQALEVTRNVTYEVPHTSALFRRIPAANQKEKAHDEKPKRASSKTARPRKLHP
ncbi:MAG: helix-turn-helix transcriptional regulator [Acidobacteria bacterium]|nr:helix-turn-helix transcriptional regulator [Acidobacteriota bacterium]